MYLKSLDMYGFKSFMDKLSVSFDYAITAIVGPNGSGKSNITDAIRWVLGEQSVKSLRGSRMEDVIFAGTAKHKPLGFAEVSLTLDNSTGLFASEYTEITVTRRVFRSGEGEYFINKTPCRLRDIHELFMDTGLGRDGYSIISQGQIDSILSQKSEDRRQIFEEAAGISKYKYKKTEAARKLVGVEENLVRVRDIFGELSARLGPLEEQSKKARMYLEYYEKLKNLEINLAIIDIEKWRAAKEETENKFRTVSEDMTAQEEKLRKLEEEETALYGEIKEQEYVLEQTRTLLHSTALSIKGWEGDNALLMQRTQAAEENARKTDEAICVLHDEIRKLEEDISAQNEEIRLLGKKREKTEKDVETGKDRLEGAEEAVMAQNKMTEDMASSASQLLAQAEEIANHISSLSGVDLIKRTEELETELEKEKNRAAENEKRKNEAEKRTEKLSDDMQKMAEDFAALAAEKAENEKLLQETKLAYNDKMREYNRLLSRKNALSDMEQNMEGYGKGVRAVLGAHLNADIRGVLSQLIRVDSEYVTAIETALGGALQNIVVGREEDAKAAIEFLKRTKNGRATFLPVSAVHGRRLENEARVASCPGFIGLGCDLVRCDDAYKEIILQLLGGVVVMDNIDNAISASRRFSHQIKIVTTEGELFMRGGSLSGGSHSQNNHLLGRGEEIERLGKECAALSAEMEKVEESIDDITDRIENIVAKREEIRTHHAAAKAEKMECEGNIRLCEAENENIEKHIERLTVDRESVRAQIRNADAEKKRLQEAEADCRRRYEEGVLRTETARGKLRELVTARTELGDQLTALQIAVSTIGKDMEAGDAAISQMQTEIQKKEELIREREKDKEALLQEAENLRLRYQNRQTDIDEAQSRQEEFRVSIDKMTEDKSDAESRAEGLRAALKEQNERLYALQGEKTRLEAKLEKTQEELESTVSHLWDAYELTYSAAAEYKTEIESVQTARTEAAALRRSIRALGSVNVDAVEEYRAVKERHDFLAGQISDLEKSMAELNKIITDMTKVMTETFAGQFEKITEHFKDTFAALFGGGTGRLSLTDPENILESGIEIDVQPPGKKLQNLSLLSGGEKALTAIAILFAVLRVRPAPFCILDEIESALDDHNIARFAAYLRDYADTQFIIVTHRRGTMEAADVLYGVTMQEKGISKLLTMQLSELKD